MRTGLTCLLLSLSLVGCDGDSSGWASCPGCDFEPWGRCAVAEQPGERVARAGTHGSGPCRGVTVAEAITAVHERHPSLADVTTLYRGGSGGVGGPTQRVHAFHAPEGGFRLAFYRGSGDCPSGCVNSEWTYFETDAQCAPRQVGAYSKWHDEPGCYEVTGTPRWGLPAPASSSIVCDAGPPPDLSGTYEVPFEAVRHPCDASRGEIAMEGMLQLEVARSEDDPTVGTLVITGEDLDDPWLQGRVLDVQVDQYRHTVALEWSTGPSRCFEQRVVEGTLDFEGCGPSVLRISGSFAATRDDCGFEGCVGMLELTLDLSVIDAGRRPAGP